MGESERRKQVNETVRAHARLDDVSRVVDEYLKRETENKAELTLLRGRLTDLQAQHEDYMLRVDLLHARVFKLEQPWYRRVYELVRR